MSSLRANAVPTPDGAAFSRHGRIFGAVYGIWDDRADDARQIAWLRRTMDGAAPLCLGSYAGEADLDRVGGLTTQSAEAADRLADLALRHDPAGLFRGRSAQPHATAA